MDISTMTAQGFVGLEALLTPLTMWIMLQVAGTVAMLKSLIPDEIERKIPVYAFWGGAILIGIGFGYLNHNIIQGGLAGLLSSLGYKAGTLTRDNVISNNKPQ